MFSRVPAVVKPKRGNAFSTLKSGINLAGIFPPIPTPFNKNESVAYDKLKSNMLVWERIPFAGYVVQGSNGEYPLLSNSERVAFVKNVRQMIPRDKILIAGSTCEGTGNTVLLSNAMAESGASAVLVTTPSYFKSSMTEAALENHFTKLADNCNVPVILYNMPANTGVDLSAPLVSQLAAHPNIIGIKDSGGDIAKISRMVNETRNLDFQVVAGSTGFLLPSLLVGCVGGVNGLANVLGHEVCRVYQLFKESRMDEAVHLHLKLVTLNSMITREMGVPGMKAALDMAGLYGGPCRQPLLPLSASQVKKLQSIFDLCQQQLKETSSKPA